MAMEATRSAQLKEIFGRIGSALGRARLSPVEIAFLAATVLFALIVLYFYATRVEPRRAELAGLDDRASAARTKLLQANERKKKLEAQQANASRIVDSLGGFERRLKDRERGTAQIINEVNRLASAHHVAASDYNFRLAVADAPAEGDGSPSSRREERDLQTYTSLAIETTLSGDYQDLRRLIAAIERGQTFMLINSVTFQGETKQVVTSAAAPGLAGAPAVQAPAGGETAVSLKLEMETYFRNDAAARAPRGAR